MQPEALSPAPPPARRPAAGQGWHGCELLCLMGGKAGFRRRKVWLSVRTLVRLFENNGWGRNVEDALAWT